MGNKCCSWKSKVFAILTQQSKSRSLSAKTSGKDLLTIKDDFQGKYGNKSDSANISGSSRFEPITQTDFKKLDINKPEHSIIATSRYITAKNSKSLHNSNESNENSTKYMTDLGKFNSDNGRLNLNGKYTKDEFIRGKFLNKGRFGSVFTGLSANTGETVALKTLDVNQSIKEKNRLEIVDKLYLAIEKLKFIHHKNLINLIHTEDIHDIEKNELTIFYEFCNGGSIKTLLEKYGKFEEKVIKLYVKQILEGLAYLHNQNIVHKNIKSSNILVDGNGTIRISDSLIDNIMMEEGQDLLDKLKDGKDIPYWVSPDLVLNSKENSKKLDIWSLGCLIIEMVSAKPAWHHYNFSNAEAFIQFLLTTHCKDILILVTPTMPKKLSKSCISFLNICFSRSSSESLATDLLNHEFLSNNLDDSLVESRRSNDNRVSVLSTSIVNKSQNKKLVNILNSIDENPMFTVSVTMVSPHSQINSINTTNNNLFNVLHNENKKILTENILEEIDTSKEHSPVIFKSPENKKYFEFNETAHQECVITEQEDYNQTENLNCEIDRFNNIKLSNGVLESELKVSDIQQMGSNILTTSKANKLSYIDKIFKQSLPFKKSARRSSHSQILNTSHSHLILEDNNRSLRYMYSNESKDYNNKTEDSPPHRATDDFQIANYISMKD